ncbi:MAG TPA: ComF family protein [Verrucomicrobiota bacterium]|nr:amidophosphoribosyltransferase [Verrucomicrobiales bacterium]HRI14237.1 ComF family protein [Verrucomicrobiota bacterium]
MSFYSLWPAARTAIESTLGLVYPNVCQLCQDEEATAAEGYVGSNCRRQLRYLQPPYCHRCGLPFRGAITQAFECANCQEVDFAFESVRAAVLAEGVALEVIHRFKYQQARWFEPFLSDLLVAAAKPVLTGAGWDLLVPVPLHPVKQRHREFNQAERLARHLGKAAQLPVRTDLVRRIEPTLTQTRLSRAARAANVRRAFRGVTGKPIEGAAVVIVDDVLTTGATTDAVARQLRRMGAARVCVWAVARAVLDGVA